jgi:hypothetical protein
MMTRTLVSFLLVAALATFVRADSAATDRALISLSEKIDTKDFQNPMTFKEFLGLLYEKLAARGLEFSGLIDRSGFQEAYPDLPDINDAPIQFPALPRHMTVADSLRTALRQLPAKAAYVVREGTIVVTPEAHAEVGYLLRTKVAASFHRQPLGEAIDMIAERSGVSVVIDRRVEDNMKMPVTARLRGNVTAEDALRLLTQAADLKIVVLRSAVFVTTPATAVEMQEELANLPPSDIMPAPDAP